MELIDVLHQISQQSQDAAQPTELKIGTVVSVSPLEISINTNMAPLQANVLYLTSAVVERKIPVLSHSHNTSGLSHTHTVSGAGSTGQSLQGSYPSDTQLTSVACIENGQTLPVENGYIILNRALVVGDTVLLLRVLHGQKFIVLSRVMEAQQ